MGQVQIGRLFGVPIVLDGSFILLALLFGFSYFTAGSMTSLSYGIVLVTGVALSILLHELGHALAARYYGVPTAFIELNGLGGLCHFARALPPSRWKNIVVLLAGPFANLILWQVFTQSSSLLWNQATSNPVGIGRTAVLLGQLGSINLMLLVFNLMPAHPLDGGRALAHLSSAFLGYDRAMRFVAYLGLLVALWLAFLGFSGSYFAFLIAFVLAQANLQALQVHGSGPRWTRWN